MPTEKLNRTLAILLFLLEKFAKFIIVAIAVKDKIQKKNNNSDVLSLKCFSVKNNTTSIMTKTRIKRLFLISNFFIFLVFFNNALLS